MKAVKLIGFALIGVTLVAVGYWRGAEDRKASPPKTATSATSESMAGMEGMEMGTGAAVVSPEKQQLLGIRIATIEARSLSKTIRTVGTVTYDETRITRIYSKIEGWVEKLHADYTGKLVQKGQPLFSMYSPDVLATQGEYLLALKFHERLSGSSIPEVRSGADSLVAASRQRLALWDISDQQIRDLEKKREPQKTLTFYAPRSGFIIKKDINEGMKVMPDKELYTIADLSTVWVDADVYESEIAIIKVGQQAAINLSYYPGDTFQGKITYIYPYLDEKTRTVKVRLAFPNPGLKLKPDMYVNAEIKIRSGKHVAVPEEAVLDTGLRKVIFIDRGNGHFEPKEVKLGSKLDGFYQVLSGVQEGEKIAASSVFLLDSESRLSEAMGAMAGMPGMEAGDVQKNAAAAEKPTQKKSGDLTISLETLKPRLGENIVRLKVSDAKGKAVQDAAVNVTFAMNMPGMAPGSTAAKRVKDGVYEAKVNLAMAGSWEITVSVQRPGQKAVQEKFTVTAR
jgi:Cu(I)/Ag(I) efflux system membrane fusion protein